MTYFTPLFDTQLLTSGKHLGQFHMNGYRQGAEGTLLSTAKQGDNALGSVRPSVCLLSVRQRSHA